MNKINFGVLLLLLCCIIYVNYNLIERSICYVNYKDACYIGNYIVKDYSRLLSF